MMHQISTLFSVIAYLSVLLVQAKWIADKSDMYLDPSILKNSTDSDIFLVAFFVSNCGRCRPVREELKKMVIKLKNNTHDIVRYGTIDCNDYKDFCVDLNITSYPSFALMERGGLHRELFHRTADLTALTRHFQSQSNLEVSLIRMKRMKNEEKCETGSVFALKPDLFHSTISSGVYLIKFYSPTCPACKKFAPVWIELAKQLKNKPLCIAETDCTAGVAICHEYFIEKVPTIIWFRDGHAIEIYKGPQNLERLHNFAQIMTDGTYKTLLADRSKTTGKQPNSLIIMSLLYSVMLRSKSLRNR